MMLILYRDLLFSRRGTFS